jgi:hypothetical protein
MIGGTDIIMPSLGGPVALDAAIRAISRHWPEAVYEDANTGDVLRHYSEISFASLQQVFVYRDAEAQRIWDELGADPAVEHDMVYLLLGEKRMTAVVSDPGNAETGLILDSVRRAVAMDILNNLFALEKAA